MRRIWVVFAAIVALLAVSLAPAHGQQCYGGRCRIVVASQAGPAWEWRERADDPGRVYLYRDGRQVGALDLERGYFRPYDPVAGWGPSSADSEPAKRWVRQRAAAAAKPAQKAEPGGNAAEISSDPPTGVVWDQIEDREVYSLAGREVSRQVAQAVTATLPTDWAGKPRLTVIGSRQERDRVLADLKGHPLAEACLVQDYDPEDSRESWAVRGPGFPAGFGIVLQAPDGRVLARATRYEGRATLDRIEQIRKPRPDYDPSKDPDPNRPRPGPAGPGSIPWLPLAGLVGISLIATVMSRK